jgi:predicted short-subunit dehydrogenase-like oxidoreductase (DUF2520 family)
LNIGFIGSGKVGKALGLYFIGHGLSVAGYYSKTFQSAQEAAQLTQTKAFDTIKALIDTCEILFITGPDHALEDIDRQIFETLTQKSDNSQKIWLHVSGAHASDCLVQIKASGYPVGSMHPLQSFGEPKASAKQLEKTFFNIEGTPKALETIQKIMKQTNGRYNIISTDQKPLYHAGACVISNYLVTLLDSGMKYLEAAGMDPKDLYQAVTPLITSTLENIWEKGTVKALTGPIVRGDIDTVLLHLKAVEKNLPAELDLYRSMALRTVAMIEERITGEQADKIREIMKGTNNYGK